MLEKVDIALIGSGSGSTGEAAIKGFLQGLMPSVGKIKAFISTVPNAGLLARAQSYNVPNFAVDDTAQGIPLFEYLLSEKVKELGVDLLVSAGCRKVIPEIPGILCINTHPQDPEKHGGNEMVGIEPHLHFLEYEIMDQLRRGRATMETPFFAKVTSHCCHGDWDVDDGLSPYDFGHVLMQVPIPIPQNIIKQAWEVRKPFRKEENLDREKYRRVFMMKLARQIQDHVLIHERQLVPMFIENAARQLLISREG